MTGRQGKCRCQTCPNKEWNFNLCEKHLAAERAAGRIAPARVFRHADDVLTDWCELVASMPAGTLIKQIAERMGMSPEGLRRAVVRGRGRGDPRAVHPRTLSPTQKGTD